MKTKNEMIKFSSYNVTIRRWDEKFANKNDSAKNFNKNCLKSNLHFKINTEINNWDIREVCDNYTYKKVQLVKIILKLYLYS